MTREQVKQLLTAGPAAIVLVDGIASVDTKYITGATRRELIANMLELIKSARIARDCTPDLYRLCSDEFEKDTGGHFPDEWVGGITP